jgi:hypothetical protein
MRDLTRLRSARVIGAGFAFVQNLRRGHYELGWDIDRQYRLTAIFAELARHLIEAAQRKTSSVSRLRNRPPVVA